MRITEVLIEIGSDAVMGCSSGSFFLATLLVGGLIFVLFCESSHATSEYDT